MILLRQPQVITFPFTTLFRSGRLVVPDVVREHGPPVLYLGAEQRRVSAVGLRGFGGGAHVRPARAAGGEQKRDRRRSREGSRDRKSTRLNSSHEWISYAVFCL